MDKKNRIAIIIVIIGLLFLTFMIWLHWYGIQEGQSTVHAYPVTLFPNGSGTAMQSLIGTSEIERAVHISERDLSEYPALREIFTGERSLFRGFSKIGGVTPGQEELFKQYRISEYNGTYYLVLVMRH